MSSSQEFIPIEDIKDDLVLLKDGGVTLILSTSAVNFGLLFDTEQLAIIQGFAGLLNSLSFPIEIVIRSKRFDVSSYLHTLDKAMSKQTNPLLAQLTTRYRQFVASIIKENNVLDKQFYLAINVTSPELGLLSQKQPEKLKRALIILLPRRDHLIRQLSRIGLKVRQLNTVEIVKLFYDIYNPDSFEVASGPELPLKSSSATVAPTKPEPIVTQTNPSPIQPAPAPIPIPTLRPTSTPPATPTIAPLSPPFVVEELSDDYGS